MAYNYVTVSGTFATLTGTVTFTPPEVTDLTGTTSVLGPGVFACTVTGGSFTTAPLLATDNIGLLPPSWAWSVTVALTGQRAYTYPVLIPAANGTAATLSSLAVSASGGGSAEGFNNPMTALGDMISGGTSGVASRIAGNTSAAKNFFTQTGTGAASAAPTWGTIASADLPAGTTSAQGALQLDGTASNIASPAPVAAPGAGTLAAISTHVHPLNDPFAIGFNANYATTNVGVASTSFTSGGSLSATYMRLTSAGYPSSNLIFSVANSSGNISVCYYTASGTGATNKPTGGQPATSGTIACPANGVATVALGATVTPLITGWVAMSCDNITATFTCGPGGSNTVLSNGQTWTQSNAHPLPGTPSSLGSGSYTHVLMKGS